MELVCFLFKNYFFVIFSLSSANNNNTKLGYKHCLSEAITYMETKKVKSEVGQLT